ncbi:CbrC family protein [Nocardioides sp.]|uniref:CbrC family protein n=1 Tax=Nocardioides sp. TaxID=35761 RepID=UPI002B898EA1|nr:CbrC family protein [Nocardioides sp.]HSX67600.1 CbrC family protein [Nocardioides sp.]
MPALPVFRYHPDPVATGSAVASDETCEVCSQPAGYKYAGGSICGGQVEVLCLRCIADGTAAARLAHPDGPAEFTDIGWGVPDDVPASVLEEVSQRTPGFIGWQEEHWMYHCSDAAAFLGLVGWADVANLPDAIESLRADLAEIGVGEDEADRQIKMMRRDGDLTGYLFRCLHCGAHLAYSDAN